MITPVKYEHLILPLDGSGVAECAVPWARLVAQKTNAVADVTTAVHKGFIPSEDLMDQLDREASASHQRAEGELQRWGVRVRRSVLSGEPSAAIAAHALESGAQLIVMATHGRSGVKRRLLGSVTDRVLRITEVPVLVIRVEPIGDLDDPVLPRTIVAPLDGSDVGRSALPVVAALGRAFEAKVVLLHSQAGSAAGQPSDTGLAARTFIADYLDQTAGELRSAGLSVDVCMSNLEPCLAIEEASMSVPRPLIVMASVGATRVGRSRRGSVADHVIRRTVSPVLVVPPLGYLGSVID